MILFVLLGVFGAGFLLYWMSRLRQQTGVWPDPLRMAIGAVTNFFDYFGIGSFATTTSFFRWFKTADDRVIPGTLNVGHTLPTIAQAYISIGTVEVDMKTLILLIGASVLGAWVGAHLVAGWSKRRVQLVMGVLLLVAAAFLLMKQVGPPKDKGGEPVGLEGPLLWVGFAGNFVLGVLMTMGIGLYTPCMVMIALLGMSLKAAFPIMMGSCAFLMPVASLRFIKDNAIDHRAALGLALGGIPAVLLAGLWVKDMDVYWLMWVTIAVVLYTGVNMLRAARTNPPARAGA